jgi:hypothetical protein
VGLNGLQEQLAHGQSLIRMLGSGRNPSEKILRK